LISISINRRRTRKYLAAHFGFVEDEQDEDESGIGAAVLAFFLGILAPIFATSLSFGQDPFATLIIVGGFAAVILYSEVQLSLSTGVSFGIGLTMTSFAAADWLMVGVSVAAVVLSLARHGLGDALNGPFNVDGSASDPTLSPT
jgi:hypothetical protein